MYEKDPNAKFHGGLAVGVPGEVAGLYTVWSHHGRLPWEKLIEPSIKLANLGFIVQPYLAFHIQDNLGYILADKGLQETFAPGGKPLREGDTCLRKNLGHTLQQIAKHGPNAFYMGDIAKAFVADVKAAGGIMTIEDLRDYKVVVRQPLVAETMGYTLISMPPPSSGGASLVLVSLFPSLDECMYVYPQNWNMGNINQNKIKIGQKFKFSNLKWMKSS